MIVFLNTEFVLKTILDRSVHLFVFKPPEGFSLYHSPKTPSATIIFKYD